MLKFGISYDADWEARLSAVLDHFSKSGYRLFFEKKDYGMSINKIFIVLMCQDAELKLKQRIRFSKKEKILYLDIMLDLNEFILFSPEERNAVAANKIITQLPLIIKKYKFEDFNLKKFESDLKRLFKTPLGNKSI